MQFAAVRGLGVPADVLRDAEGKSAFENVARSQSIDLTSGHFVQRDNPTVAIDVIKTIVMRAGREAGVSTGTRADESAHLAMTADNEKETVKLYPSESMPMHRSG